MLERMSRIRGLVWPKAPKRKTLTWFLHVCMMAQLTVILEVCEYAAHMLLLLPHALDTICASFNTDEFNSQANVHVLGTRSGLAILWQQVQDFRLW